MALSSIPVVNNDHFSYGGVKKLEIASTFTVAVTDDLIATATLTSPKLIEFEKESSKMSVSSSSNDSSFRGYNVTIEGYIPKMKRADLVALQQMQELEFVTRVYMWDAASATESYIIGWDNVTSDNAATTRFGCKVESVELDSGAALSDQNGVTLKLSCVMGQFPGQIA
jgi:hypothetical protein